MKKHTYGPRCVSWAFFLVIGHCIRRLHLPVVVVPRCLPPLPPPVLSFVVPLRVGAVRHRRCARAVVGCIHSHPLLLALGIGGGGGSIVDSGGGSVVCDELGKRTLFGRVLCIRFVRVSF
jgi:hypothetical protein